MTFLAYWPADYAFFMGFMAFLLVACVVSRLLRRQTGDQKSADRQDT